MVCNPPLSFEPSSVRNGIASADQYTSFFSPKESHTFSDDLYLNVLRQTLQQIDVIHRMIGQYPHIFGLAQSVADVWSVFRSGRIASLIGVEGLHQIANSPSTLRNLHRLGVRYVTLAHTRNNRYCDSAVSDAYFIPVQH
jgi:membrane dipeptidase